MTTPYEVLAVAATVWDQKTHSEADLAFLRAIMDADKDWFGALSAANKTFGGGSEAWQIVKRLATKTRNAAYLQAMSEFEAHDEIEFQQAAE